MADVDFKFKQKTPASRFTSKISSVMQKPLPREWLLSGQSLLRKFDPKLIEQAVNCLRPDNFRMTIVSRNFPGDWDQQEKWYGTEYKHGRIPAGFMDEIKSAASCSAKDRLPALHLPHRNNFIPTKLEVEKKDIKDPSLAPKIVRNDAIARMWWKQDDTFWVPKANLVVSCKNPIIYASAENAVKARLYTDLVRDALEEYSYDAELAGLQYNVTLDSRGLFLDLSGYNDKLSVLLEQVLITMRDLEIKDDRFEIIKERLNRGYSNWELQQAYSQVSDYTTWLNSERDYVVEETAAELPGVTAEAVRQFQKQMLSQMHVEVYLHGNVYKEDALKLVDMVESTLKPRVLPPSQWPIIRSLILPPGSNFIYKKTLKDYANVNHCIETWLYVGDKGDRMVRAKTLLFDQISHEPAFDQLRTKEQLGYVVFSGVRSFSTTYGFRFIIQSEKTPEYLDSRTEVFLASFAQSLKNMSDADFEGHKRSLIVRRLEKLKNLDQESSRHWSQISSEYYDFELGECPSLACRDSLSKLPLTLLCHAANQDAAHVKQLTKAEMMEFYNQYINPSSPTRAKVAVYLYAQSTTEGKEKVTEIVKALDLSNDASAKVQAALLQPEKRKDTAGLRALVEGELKLPQAKVVAIMEAAKLPELNAHVNGVSKGEPDEATPASPNLPVVIEDVRAFKAGLVASSGARPVKEMSEYEDIDSKL
jgi:insulysin